MTIPEREGIPAARIRAQAGGRARQFIAGQDLYLTTCTGSRPAPETVIHTLPRDVAAFTGREDELQQLGVTVGGTGGVTGIHTVDGMPGVGKTALVTRAAHLLSGAFPDGQLFVQLHAHTPGQKPIDPGEVLGDLLICTGMTPNEIPAGVDARALRWRDRLTGKKMLLVLDDAADHAQVEPLLPGAAGCLVLVTSRRRLIALDGARPLPLETLPPREAAELFIRLARRAAAEGTTSAVTEMVKLCGYLPLAIALLAGRLAHHPSWSITDLAASFAAAHDRLAELIAGDRAVAAAFELSYRDLPATQRRLFRRLSLHPGAEVNVHAASALGDIPLDLSRRSLDALYNDHLVEETAPGRYRLHDLLRAYAAELTRSTDSDSERRAAAGRMLDHYLHTAHSAALRLHPSRRPITLAAATPGVEPEHIGDGADALAWFQAERRVLMAAAGRALEAGFDTHAWQMAWALSRFLDTRGRWQDWAAIEQIALTATGRLGDQAAQASAHQRFGFVSGRLGRYEDAYTHLELALGIHTERGDHAGQAYVQHALALTLNNQGRYAEALGHAQRALESWTAAGDLPGRAMALNSAGWFHGLLGDHQQALACLRQSLGLFRDLGHDEGVASVLDSLGYVHQQLGSYAEATACYRKALGLYREIGGRWGAAETLGHLGDAQHAAGNPAQARLAWEEALVILDDLGHPDADQIRAKLAELASSPRSEVSRTFPETADPR
ncbi:MAG: tetratricopeptide repeat protein [Streptosporangiaceae bacterium]|nr:tetratricopeptide repeat protein [Streptosporangiaceae bacterium]